MEGAVSIISQDKVILSEKRYFTSMSSMSQLQRVHCPSQADKYSKDEPTSRKRLWRHGCACMRSRASLRPASIIVCEQRPALRLSLLARLQHLARSLAGRSPPEFFLLANQ